MFTWTLWLSLLLSFLEEKFILYVSFVSFSFIALHRHDHHLYQKYNSIFQCKRCPEGCNICKDESPCLFNYNWILRITLLTITIVCIMIVLFFLFSIYLFRRVKVFQVASPIFLYITLIGCAMAYFEVIYLYI